MKKRALSLVLCAAAIMALCGCGSKSESSAPSVAQPDNDRVNPVEEVKPEWEYKEMYYGSGFAVTAYNGKSATATIPSEIDGAPITQIGYSFSVENDVTTTLKIPACIEYIGSINGKGLTDFVVEEGNERYYSKDGCLYYNGYFASTFIRCPQGRSGTVTVEDRTKLIERNAFEDCAGLTSVGLPESLESIGGAAFSDCASLTDVNLPEGLTSIGYSAFQDCTSLETLDIPETVTDIGSNAFYGTPFLQKLIEQDPMVVINGILVEGKKLSGEVTVPDNVTAISANAFSSYREENTEIKKVILPEGMEEIDGAFEHCAGLEEVVLPKSLKKIGSNAFGYCGNLKCIELPSGLTSIGMFAFNCCESLTSVDIPDGVTLIDMGAFAYCKNLERASVPDSVVNIVMNDCFEGCEKINVTFRGKTYTAANMDEFYAAVEENAQREQE